MVATLTAEHDAAWDRRPGQDLYAGQHFTLNAGVAEITTRSGAVALLQAPATVELLNNKNAIRLHRGQLIGVCETDTSKGFLVRTPHMDVTDLGTRFGIDTTQAATSVLVYQREVLASLPSAADDSQTATAKVTSGQAFRASADSEALTRIDFDPSPFEQIGPRITQLPGTGQGLAVGDTDPNWQIVAVDGQVLDVPITLPVFEQPREYRQPYPNDPQRSQWLALPAPIRQPAEGSTYVFRTQIELSESFDARTDRVVGRFMVDNAIRVIRINGQAIAFP